MMLRPCICASDFSLAQDAAAHQWALRTVSRTIAEMRSDVVCVQDRGGPDEWVAAAARSLPIYIWREDSGHILRCEPEESSGRQIGRWTWDVRRVPPSLRPSAIVESLVYYVHARTPQTGRPCVLYLRDARAQRRIVQTGRSLFEQARTCLANADSMIFEWRGAQ